MAVYIKILLRRFVTRIYFRRKYLLKAGAIIMLFIFSCVYSYGFINGLTKATWNITKPNENFRLNLSDHDLKIVQQIQQRIPNLPIMFWYKMYDEGLRENNSVCGAFPDLFSLKYSNSYWQTLYTTDGIFQLFGAYLDARKNNIGGPVVRILGMINRYNPSIKTYCHIWFDNQNRPAIAPIFEYRFVFYNDKFSVPKSRVKQPYLMACKVPKRYWNETAPLAVSVVENQCDIASNLLNVFYNIPKGTKKDFAVCVKGLNFPYTDLSIKLAEWIEALNLVGADKIFFYKLAVHKNVSKMLNYYETKGNIHVTSLKIAGNQPSQPLLQHYFLSKKIPYRRRNEVIPYNDCFYKHVYEYKYIVLLDIDEIIMPIKVDSWKELISDVKDKSKNKTKSHYYAQNVYFLDNALHKHGWFDDIPQYMHMLQHVYRSKNFTRSGSYVKSFFNTENVLTVHNHRPYACIGGCSQYAIDKIDAQLQHYREDCVPELRKSCGYYKNYTVVDKTIWKFKQPLIARVSATLSALGYSESDFVY